MGIPASGLYAVDFQLARCLKRTICEKRKKTMRKRLENLFTQLHSMTSTASFKAK